MGLPSVRGGACSDFSFNVNSVQADPGTVPHGCYHAKTPAFAKAGGSKQNAPGAGSSVLNSSASANNNTDKIKNAGPKQVLHRCYHTKYAVAVSNVTYREANVSKTAI